MKVPDFASEAQCPGRNHPQRFGGPYLSAPSGVHIKLLISGPEHDGFWVRAQSAVATARWAVRRGWPFTVMHNSSRDAYYNASLMGPNAWNYYFEPVDRSPRDAPTFELPCRVVYEVRITDHSQRWFVRMYVQCHTSLLLVLSSS
jgi:hypothetical protein